MNSLVKKGMLQEMECGTNVAYVLSDNSDFSPMDYKVMQSQKDSGFIQCMKMLFNGKTQLYYKTAEYKSLISIIGSIDIDTFMTIAENLISEVIEVKNNGFLSCQNIDVSFERIYINTATYKVKLLYLPLKSRLFDGYSEFENELRISLVKLISGLDSLSSPKTIQFKADLSNGLLTIEDIYKKIKNNQADSYTQTNEKKQHGAVSATGTYKKQLKLVAMDSPSPFEMVITKSEFIIGKKENAVDAIVDYNKGISRVHCKIIKQNEQYFVVDLQSMNGTFINKSRLLPNDNYPVKHGDIISLANSNFRVIIE